MWFTVYSGTGVALYCSELCADRRVNTGRKAREAGRKLTPKRRLAVFERDEWVCQLCWEDIDPALKVPDPWAGTIDHAIPLACDGEHNEDNWQAAHFKCNSMKGANAAY